jgi:hypothetical protein
MVAGGVRDTLTATHTLVVEIHLYHRFLELLNQYVYSQYHNWPVIGFIGAEQEKKFSVRCIKFDSTRTP